ncbi:receptor like protein 27-like [Lycium barbarum]|uniref:receptor like protein 27-like n=1 Tax=Lycium barbarum TaxID=112863 RepID=UPI00293E3E32|nr:receptor like protein 27-like [Lycium barbarum]
MFYLDLSVNQIKEVWVWRVGNRVYLNLSCNLLESLEKPYNMSTSLQLIDFHSNRINGDPPILPTSLIYFSIANNKLTGSIPSSICNLHHLQYINMSNNSINSKLPPCLFQKSDSLVVLNLGRNKLSGIIPDTFPQNCNLRTLDLNSNILEGKFPRSLQGCAFLEVLDIRNNKIRNTFPCMLKKFSNLHVLVLRPNMFHGNLRCLIANNETWSKLQIIDLLANNFSGSLPTRYFSSRQGMMLSSNPDQVGSKHL